MSTAVTGGSFSYTVSVTNPGQGNLENIQLVEVISLSGTTREPLDLPTDFTLLPGASREIEVVHNNVPNNSGEVFSVVVTAIATRQDGFQVQASASETITIIPSDIVF